MNTLTEMAEAIYDDGCIWFAGPGEAGRTLRKHKEHPNAPRSPYFVSLRTPDVLTHGGEGTLSQGTVDEIGRFLWQRFQELGLTTRLIAPIPNAAVAYGEAMVRAAADDGVSLVVVPLTKEGEGSTGSITGVEPGEWQDLEDDEVVPIDDLITAAGTKRDAIRVLREAGLTVNVLMVVIDREQGGAAELEKIGVKLVALLMFSALVMDLAEAGVISGYQLGRYDQYIEDDKLFNLDHELA